MFKLISGQTSPRLCDSLIMATLAKALASDQEADTHHGKHHDLSPYSPPYHMPK